MSRLQLISIMHRPVDDALSKREYQREFEGNRRLRKFEEFRSRHVSHCDQIRTTAVRFSREDNHYPANRGPSTVKVDSPTKDNI